MTDPNDAELALAFVAILTFCVLFAFRLGRLYGRREVATTLRRTVGDWAAARRARTSQDARERPDGLRDLPGLSDAERAAWDARELP